MALNKETKQGIAARNNTNTLPAPATPQAASSGTDANVTSGKTIFCPSTMVTFL
ncbi:hypothetical protein [Desulfovibrio psychrotolerans]|uniref:hypothetical protein n=1 Tax=Desulfovibrio psychrotolerans TaxID=415242 RepID=UPI00157B43AE|nr:hypothetical protein [Desulfovibrio psychrotolerans]